MTTRLPARLKTRRVELYNYIKTVFFLLSTSMTAVKYALSYLHYIFRLISGKQRHRRYLQDVCVRIICIIYTCYIIMITRNTSLPTPSLIVRLKIAYSFLSKPARSVRFYTLRPFAYNTTLLLFCRCK